MATPENKIKREINKLLNKYGCYRFMPVPGQFGKKTVDYLVCVDGHFLGIEAKAPGKEPTALQEITLRGIVESGGWSLVVDGPEGLTILEALLDEHCSRFPSAQVLGRAA